jgi:hypothetical protein
MTRAFKITGLLLLVVVVTAIGIWGALAISFLGPQNEIFRLILTLIFVGVCIATLIALAFPYWRWRILAVYCFLLMVILFWFFSIKPSDDRDWQTDVAVLPYATVQGNIVDVHNIRNFDYRSETDYTPAYYDKRFDLNKLNGVDIIAVYWMGPAIAHVFLSFAFEGGDHIAVSIETRKEKGEEYSTLKGFFRQYELYYVVADERDVIRLRTNYRHNPPEDVYVYRASGPMENGRRLFMTYIDKINSLKNKPSFYNTLTSNCTTSIWMNTHVNEKHVPFSWKILVSGYLPEFLYDQDRLDSGGLSFTELQRSAHVNARAKVADTDKNFSSVIRKIP